MDAVASAGYLFGEAAQWNFGIEAAVLGAALCQTLGPLVARLLHCRAVRRGGADAGTPRTAQHALKIAES